MSRLKISAISYLNTAPLMWDFEHAAAGAGQVAGLAADLAANYEISYTIPSACAEALRAGTADIGIIPAAAYTTVPDLVIIPDVAIGPSAPCVRFCWSAKSRSIPCRLIPCRLTPCRPRNGQRRCAP